MYKDKDKQREAGRERARRYRENRQKALLSKGVTEGVTIWESEPGAAKKIDEIAMGGTPLPERTERGKNCNCFEDLPPDVQATIRRLSESNEEFQRRVGIAIRYQHLFPDRYHSTGVGL